MPIAAARFEAVACHTLLRVVLGVVMLAGGCIKPAAPPSPPAPTPPPRAPTLAELQMVRYPELVAGRFRVLADFEVPFPAYSPSGPAQRGTRGPVLLTYPAPTPPSPPPVPVPAGESSADGPPTGPAANSADDPASLEAPSTRPADVPPDPRPAATTQPASAPSAAAPAAVSSVPWRIESSTQLAATGQRSLAWRFRDVGDALGLSLLAAGPPAQGPGSPASSADLSAYSMLLLSVHSSQGCMVKLEIPAAGDPLARWISEPYEITPGWNTLRVDLADVAEWADLRDLSRVWLVYAGAWPQNAERVLLDRHPARAAERERPGPAGEPPSSRVDPTADQSGLLLHVDDLIVADDTQWVMGRLDAPAGQMVGFWRGERWWMGLSGQVVWSLRGGMVRSVHPWGQWNLPPTPQHRETQWTLLPERGSGGGLPGALTVAGLQAPDGAVGYSFRILEASPLRMVVEAVWKWAPGQAAQELRLRWWLTPDGALRQAVLVQEAAADPVGGFLQVLPGPSWIHADASFADRSGPPWLRGRWWQEQSSESPAAVPAVLLVPLMTQAVGLALEQETDSLPARARTRIVWRTVQTGSPARQRVGAVEWLPLEEALGEELAASASAPAEPRGALQAALLPMARWLRQGEARAGVFDADQDGYSEIEGVYSFAPVGGRVLVEFDAGQTPRNCVLIRILGVPPNAAVLATQDGQPIRAPEHLGRDSEGDVLIRLPRPVRGRSILRVELR